MRTGGIGESPFLYTWSFPLCPHRVSIGLSVVEGLQQEMASGAEPRQGVLFGQTAPGQTRIDAWTSVPALDRALMAAVQPPAQQEVLGYYTIRDGSAFMLSPVEVSIANEVFTKQGSVMLLVERRKKGPAEATFFFWRAGVFVHNLPLPFPFHAGILSGEAPNNPAAPPPFAVAPPQESSAPKRGLQLGIYAVAAIAGAGLLMAYLRDGHTMARRPSVVETARSQEAGQWIRTQPRQDLELSWNPRAQAVTTATAGVLRIDDGGVTRQMSLDVGELLMGTVLYAPTSERIRVELVALQRDGQMVQTSVSAHAVTDSVASAPPPDPGPLPLPKKDDAASKKEEITQPVQPVQKAPIKRFQWTVADRTAPVPTPSAPVMPDLLPHAAPPPPKAPAAAPAPVKPVIRSGRIIWTGTLQRRGIVELDGHSVSVGALTGSLPGAPVNLAITPAEFVDNGLVVYTTDPARNNRVEPPSAGNGWNQIRFVWDPERAKQISILEAPNESNGYNRVTLRSDARHCSMIFIDWSLR